jgi:hypothetical protein
MADEAFFDGFERMSAEGQALVQAVAAALGAGAAPADLPQVIVRLTELAAARADLLDRASAAAADLMPGLFDSPASWGDLAGRLARLDGAIIERDLARADGFTSDGPITFDALWLADTPHDGFDPPPPIEEPPALALVPEHLAIDPAPDPAPILLEEDDLIASRAALALWRWSLAARYVDLQSAADAAALDPNAVVPLGTDVAALDGDAAELVFPSFFCARKDGFLVTLAALAREGVGFELRLARLDDGGATLASAMVWPTIDPDCARLLAELNPAQARFMTEAGAQLDQIVDAIRAAP